jgi:hypothetical protein
MIIFLRILLIAATGGASAPILAELPSRVLDGAMTSQPTGGDITKTLQDAIEGGLVGTVTIPSVHIIDDLFLSKDIHAAGAGHLIGRPPKGARPSTGQLTKFDSGARLALLQAYYSSTVTISRSVTVRGYLDLRDLLIRSVEGATLTVTGELRLANVALHNVQLQANGKGFVEATDLISSDSPAVGLYATRGGTISAAKALVVNAKARGSMVQYGGVIDISGGHVSYSGSQGLYVLFGGTIILARGIVERSGSHGALINYGGSIDISNGVARDNRGSGIVAESNGAIYAENTAISGNFDTGISTSYGGIVNAEGATISRNNSYAAYANGSGYINLKNAVVDSANNAARDGQILRAIGNGFILAEEPGIGTGKKSLKEDSYYPGYNTTGNGIAYVGTVSQNFPIVSLGGIKAATSAPQIITKGTIKATALLQLVNTDRSGPYSELSTISLSSPVDVVILRAANDARAVTIKHNVGNIFLRGGNDVVLSNRDQLILLVKLHSKWVQP